MNKFWALIITADRQLNRAWLDTSNVLAYLKENKSAKIYRVYEYQEAILVEATDSTQDQILWQDVTETKVG